MTRQTEPPESRRRENHGIVLTAAELGKAGIDIAPDAADFRIREKLLRKKLTPQTAGSDDARSRRTLSRDEHIADIPAGENRPDVQPRRQLYGHILGTVDGEIDLTGEQGGFYFLDEYAAPAESGKRYVLYAVALGAEDDNFRGNFRKITLYRLLYQLCLCQGKLTAPCPDADLHAS